MAGLAPETLRFVTHLAILSVSCRLNGVTFTFPCVQEYPPLHASYLSLPAPRSKKIQP